MLDMLDALLGAVERKVSKSLLIFVHGDLHSHGKCKLTIMSHEKSYIRSIYKATG